MIRIVAFGRAFIAGAAGALAWELTLRLLALAGLPLVDMVRSLGTLFVPAGPFWLWWAAGLAIHLAVGALGAVCYAYVFWSLVRCPPLFQGLLFGAISAALSILVLYPLLMSLHASRDVLAAGLWDMIVGLSWHERAGLLLGNLIYGGVLGSLYTRSVGRSVDRPAKLPTGARPIRKGARRVERREPGAFIFATGIECSYPTVQNGRFRRDEMESTGHYRNWERDLELAAEIGVSHLRWGPPLYLTYYDRGRFDWSFADAALGRMRELGLEPIADLCHFGLPNWLGDFQNPELPDALRDYAAAFAARYPWVRFYTPVNEIYVSSRMSALDGAWNEQRRDERSFVRATCHLVKASLLMCEEIMKVRPDAVLVNSESGEFYQACCPDEAIGKAAAFENERRFLALDLLFSNPVTETMRDYLFRHGVSPDHYGWFMERKVPERSILGVDYYEWNEKLIDADGNPQSLGELFGWHVIAKQYYARYRRPMMHTETNRLDAREGPRWLWRQWHNVRQIQQEGIPVIGFTWYSLTDQVDWDNALRDLHGNVNPVGLFDLNREARGVGQAYKFLIETFRTAPDLAVYPPLRDLLS